MTGSRDHDDPEWVAERRQVRARRTAAGSGRHWDDPAKPVVRSSSAQLRRTERARARLDVVCRRVCIARVLGTAVPGAYEVGFEAVGMGGGLPATVTSALGAGGRQAFPGYAMQLIPLEVGVPIQVACRCKARLHHLDPLALRQEAWEGRPGHPREVHVSVVEVGGSG